MRDNMVAEPRFAANKWKKDNQRNLFTGEIDAGQALSEAAEALEEMCKFADTVNKLRAEGWYMGRTKTDAYGSSVETMPLPEPPKEET